MLALDRGGEFGEDFLLQREGALGGCNDERLGLHQLLRCETHRSRHGLTVLEALGQRLAQERLGGTGGSLQIKAQDIIVPDAQRLDPSLGHVLGLKLGQHLTIVVAQATRRIELRAKSLPHKAAVAPVLGQIVRQGRGELLGKGDGASRQRADDCRQIDGQADGTRRGPHQLGAAAGRAEAVAHRRQIARATALQEPSGQGRGQCRVPTATPGADPRARHRSH